MKKCFRSCKSSSPSSNSGNHSSSPCKASPFLSLPSSSIARSRSLEMLIQDKNDECDVPLILFPVPISPRSKLKNLQDLLEDDNDSVGTKEENRQGNPIPVPRQRNKTPDSKNTKSKEDNKDEFQHKLHLKTRSCETGLNRDVISSSTKLKTKSSLLSTPSDSEVKRKKNFMDKCVDKVRCFMKK